MVCKVLYYNKHTHILVVDYEGVRIQFTAMKYGGEKYVDIEQDGNKFSVSTEVTKKTSRSSNRKNKRDEDNIQPKQPISIITEENVVASVD